MQDYICGLISDRMQGVSSSSSYAIPSDPLQTIEGHLVLMDSYFPQFVPHTLSNNDRVVLEPQQGVIDRVDLLLGKMFLEVTDPYSGQLVRSVLLGHLVKGEVKEYALIGDNGLLIASYNKSSDENFLGWWNIAREDSDLDQEKLFDDIGTQCEKTGFPIDSSIVLLSSLASVGLSSYRMASMAKNSNT